MPAYVQGLKRTRTIVIPFGSVEEHGRHLPLGTDTVHAFELAREASRRHPLFVAPPLWYGLCRSTSRHPGTVSISSTCLRLLAKEVVISFYGQGLRNFILLSGHAGGTHMSALADCSEELLSLLPESRLAVLTVLDLTAKACRDIVETPGDSHAGEVETSLMLFLRPDHVCGTSPEEYPSFPGPILVRDKKRYWPGGVWGDPSKASLEKGRTVLEREADALVELVRTLETFTEE